MKSPLDDAGSTLRIATCCTLLASACATTRADRAPRAEHIESDHRAATLLLSTCNNSYNVIGAVDDGVETESINGNVFTDTNPFECEMVDDEQQVDFTFNASTTDPVTGCTYDLAYEHKSTSGSFSGTVTLHIDRMEIHFGVVATPVASDPDCNGLSVIDVDPKIKITASADEPVN